MQELSGIPFIYVTEQNTELADALYMAFEEAHLHAYRLYEIELSQEQMVEIIKESVAFPHIILFAYCKDKIKPSDLLNAASLASETLNPLVAINFRNNTAEKYLLKTMVSHAKSFLNSEEVYI